jgi:hypothetical protein
MVVGRSDLSSASWPHLALERKSEFCEDEVGGWEALPRWGDDVARIEPLAGGASDNVWSVSVNGHLAVSRLRTRSDADLAWETELLQHLGREGLTVPLPIPTADGWLFAGGPVVMT